MKYEIRHDWKNKGTYVCDLFGEEHEMVSQIMTIYGCLTNRLLNVQKYSDTLYYGVDGADVIFKISLISK
jgi:hypothetical protein